MSLKLTDFRPLNFRRRHSEASMLPQQCSEQLVAWQPSTDGKFLIGRMILDRNSSKRQNAENILGLKVVGGKRTESGRLGAFVIKVKKGSVADTTGHLKRGDEVIMWNRNCLQDATYDQVCDAILTSKSERMVELVVSRPIEDTPRIPATRRHQLINQSSSSSFDSQKREDELSQGRLGRSNQLKSNSRDSMTKSSPQITRKCADCCSSSSGGAVLPGRLQVRLSYEGEQLFVTILRASDLSLRQGIFKRNPYVKMYLLPDRSEISKRRTKTEKKTLSPRWNQSFVYAPIRQGDLESMSLELSLWDLDRSVETNNHFIGEAIVDLGLVPLDDRSQWFDLLPFGGELLSRDYTSSPMTSRRRSSPHDSDGHVMISRLLRTRQSVSNIPTNRNNSSSANQRSDNFRKPKSSSVICTSSSGSINPEDSETKSHHRKLPTTPTYRSNPKLLDISDFSSRSRSQSDDVTKPMMTSRDRSDSPVIDIDSSKNIHRPSSFQSPQRVLSNSRIRINRRNENCWDDRRGNPEYQNVTSSSEQ